MTALPNRPVLEAELDRLTAGARRHGRSLCIAIVGVDGLRALNHDHGRQAGDAVLNGVGAALEARLRASDMVGRWDGDRFMVLLPETAAAGARVVASDLRATVETTSPPTVSVGWAEWHGESAGELVERALEALRRAKSEGGNQIAEA